MEFLVFSDSHGNVSNISAALERQVKSPDAILFLGDYSLDHWAWNVKGSWLTEGKSYTKQFVETYLKELPAPHFMLAGNHEQYGEELWKSITGFSRSGQDLR